MTSDLFGRPLSTHGLNPQSRARLLYAAGDACDRGTAARAEYYRAAAQAQREWDAKCAKAEAAAVRILTRMDAERERSLAATRRHS